MLLNRNMRSSLPPLVVLAWLCAGLAEGGEDGKEVQAVPPQAAGNAGTVSEVHFYYSDDPLRREPRILNMPPSWAKKSNISLQCRVASAAGVKPPSEVVFGIWSGETLVAKIAGKRRGESDYFDCEVPLEKATFAGQVGVTVEAKMEPPEAEAVPPPPPVKPPKPPKPPAESDF